MTAICLSGHVFFSGWGGPALVFARSFTSLVGVPRKSSFSKTHLGNREARPATPLGALFYHTAIGQRANCARGFHWRRKDISHIADNLRRHFFGRYPKRKVRKGE